MKKKTTTREDFVAVRLWGKGYDPRPYCPFKNRGDMNNFCEYAYTEKCYTCDISRFAWEEWRKSK